MSRIGAALISSDQAAVPAATLATGENATLNDLTVNGTAVFNGPVTLGNAAADNITVTGTLTSNLIFTDATYDIGATGATRPRDLFLSRTATIGTSIISPTIGPVAGQQHTLPAVASDTVALIAATQTLTNKTIAIGSNTVSGTTAQFNTALTDNDFATLAGTETFTNKTFTAPDLNAAAPATPIANRLYSDSIIKGWVETSGAGAWTIDDDLNVSSITDNATGDFTINWATAFGNTNYAVVATAITTTALFVTETTTTAKSTTAVRMTVISDAGTFTDPTTGVSVIAIGHQ